MSNPFDDVLDSDDTKGESKKEEKKGKDEIKVSFSLSKRWMERIIFLVIILAELYFILANPICDNSCKTIDIEKDMKNEVNAADENTNLENNEADTSKEDTKEAEKEDNSAGGETEAESSSENQATTTTKSTSQSLEFEVHDVEYERDEDGKPLKMTSMKISITNNLKEFTPKLEIYWYANDADNSIKEMVRAEKILGRISTGNKYTYTLTQGEFSPRYFLSHGTETLKALLYDSNTGEIIDTKTMTIS